MINLYYKQKMHLNVKIEDHSFKLSVGSAHNDWAWFSHYAARKFSKITYPQGTYLPTQLVIYDKLGQEYCPHPKQKINCFLEENKLSCYNLTVMVKIRKGNHAFSEFEKVWQKEAFGIDRLMMSVIYIIDTNDKYKNRQGEKQFYFRVSFNYTMHPDVKHFFSPKQYSSPISLILDEKETGAKSVTFKGQIKLPYGIVAPELFIHKRDPKDPESYRCEKVKDIQLKQESFKTSLIISPKYVSLEQSINTIAEEMKISENIAKSLQEKEMEAKKRNANSSLCCYTFEQFWKILEQNHGDELSLESYDKSTRERLKIILEKSLNSLYEIFFYYFIIQNQTKEKKEELGITYQDAMHFLRFYNVFPDLEGLQGFFEFYNSDFKFKNIKQTVDIEEKSVRFPQFINILLRALQFIQTSTFMVKGETFDVSVAKAIDQIIETDAEEEEFSELKRNIRENPKIISFLRNHAASLKEIFVNQAMRSTQLSAENYVIMKEEFKSLLELSGLTQKNTDAIIQEMFEELNFSEEGIFYYEFIEGIQWLSLALVSSDKDETMNALENEEQQALLVIEKMKFFIQKVQL